MPRVTVVHLTPARRLPLIEVEGLRTRVDLSDRLGPPGPEDLAAPGRYGHGRRVSAYLDDAHARSMVGERGPGRISFSVDPAKALGVPGSARGDDPAAYWEQGRALEEWLVGEPPPDLEVHLPVAVRAKHLRLHAPLVSDEDLGEYAPLVLAVADTDRLSAKALMHLALVASEGEFDSSAFLAASALAYRDEPDPDDLARELIEIGADKVASAALAEHTSAASDAVTRLREVLDDVRAWADAEGIEHGRALLVRSTLVLEDLPEQPG